MKHIRIYGLLIMLTCTLQAAAWDFWPLPMDNADKANDSITYCVGIGGLSSTGKYAPFWLQNGRYGAIASSQHSGFIMAGIYKPAAHPARWYDYDFAAEAIGSVYSDMPNKPALGKFPMLQGKNASFAISQLYAHARLYVIDITAGIHREKAYLPDCSLSSGSLLFSENASAAPGFSIGIDDYMAFPGLYGYAEIKGHIGQHWLTDDIYTTKTMLHYKYVGARLGGRLPVHLSYEFHHVAQWGGFSPKYGDLGNDLPSFWNAFIAGAGGTMYNDQLNAQGNHIVMQQWRLDFDKNGWHASAYWQTLFEDHSLAFSGCGTAGRDGLYGICLSQEHWPFISGLCIEHLETTDQSGPFHDQDGLIFAGNDSYYVNSIYETGWTYYGRTIGTPFITSPLYNEDGNVSTLNNRVKVWHLGIKGDIYGFEWRILASYVRNYGRYSQSAAYHYYDSYSVRSTNTALMLDVNKHVEKAWGLDFSLQLASDLGSQYGNTFGAMLTIRKQGIIWTK